MVCYSLTCPYGAERPRQKPTTKIMSAHDKIKFEAPPIHFSSVHEVGAHIAISLHRLDWLNSSDGFVVLFVVRIRRAHSSCAYVVLALQTICGIYCACHVRMLLLLLYCLTCIEAIVCYTCYVLPVFGPTGMGGAAPLRAPSFLPLASERLTNNRDARRCTVEIRRAREAVLSGEARWLEARRVVAHVGSRRGYLEGSQRLLEALKYSLGLLRVSNES